MVTYCKGCRLHWEKLLLYTDQVNNEEHELCPVCQTNITLEESDQKSGCVINERYEIVETATGRIIPNPRARKRKSKESDWKKDPLYHEKRIAKEDEAIQKYIDSRNNDHSHKTQ